VQLKLQGADREHRRLVWRQPRQGDSNYSVVEEVSPVLSPAATVNIRYNSFRMSMPRPRGPDGRFTKVHNNGSWLQMIGLVLVVPVAEALVAPAASWIWSKLSGNRVPAAPVGPDAPAVPVQPVPLVAPVLLVAPVAPVEEADREGNDDQEGKRGQDERGQEEKDDQEGKDDQEKQNAINRVNPGVFYQFNDVYHVDGRCSILPNGSNVQIVRGHVLPAKICGHCLHQL